MSVETQHDAARARGSLRPEVSQRTRYTVEKELASGGMGVVYRVWDHGAQEARVLKRLRPDVVGKAVAVRAIEREYQVLASLRHPRIIRVFDYGLDDLGPYYTMEFVEGEDVRSIAPVPFREACSYLRDVATSLALLHARRLLHRDVSARNVRRTRDGHCKLLDFGALATFGPSSVVAGTAPALPPEALSQAPLDQRADLYSLGALAYWLLTGRHAYPAKTFSELPEVWKRPLPPPSAFDRDIPRELDTLVLSLLQHDSLARPASAAEVIARLNAIGELAPEGRTEEDVLAQSFLLNPRFTGRTAELEGMEGRIRRAMSGRGGAVSIAAASGMGRTRFVEEVLVRGQLAGAVVLSADASMYRHLHGTARALAVRLFDAEPALACEVGRRYRAALVALGPEIERRLDARFSTAPVPPTAASSVDASLEGWFAEISREKPLLIAVDNVDEADHASLGLIAALAKTSSEHPLLLVVSERIAGEGPPSLGLRALRNHTTPCKLPELSQAELFELVRSLFGDAPNGKRFAEWLHERTAGSPLHAVEICRQLAAKQVIRYSGGVWTLPLARPDAELPAALGDALSLRIASLSDSARLLAECLSLQRQRPTLELCRLLCEPLDERAVLDLLAELARTDVLYADEDGYRFSSLAIREALVANMDDVREDQNHKRLGEAFVALASEHDGVLRIQAGYHLIKGGEDLRGARLIADVATESATVRTLMANSHRVGQPLEAALAVYRRHRKSQYETMPLLAALAQAGYYEERVWGERYGDQALDVLEGLAGLRTARSLRRICGRLPSLVVGILFAIIRFYWTKKQERPYSFAQVLVHLMTTVTTLAGTASLSLDPERATRVADVLEPFAGLPEKLTPVGIYQFCRGLQEIGRDDEARAYERFVVLQRRFEDPRYYPTLPDDARKLYVAAAHFTRATFAIFRADGKGALESADALDATGLQLYAMIASQLRFLYWMNRGEFAKAEAHREQVELAAVQVGSVWQVETWESPALMLVYTLLSDVVAATRVAHRLELMSRSVPALRKYSRLAKQELTLARGETSTYVDLVAREYASHEPRSYIGWAATMSYLVQAYNTEGRHADAKALSERVLEHVTDADRDYVSLFMNLDIQAALADAGLGRTEEARARIDGLLARFSGCDHPLVHGLLHEARARIALAEGDVASFRESSAEVERRFRPTETPVLIAKCEQLARLGAGAQASSEPSVAPPANAVTLVDLPEMADETELLENDTSCTENARRLA